MAQSQLKPLEDIEVKDITLGAPKNQEVMNTPQNKDENGKMGSPIAEGINAEEGSPPEFLNSNNILDHSGDIAANFSEYHFDSQSALVQPVNK